MARAYGCYDDAEAGDRGPRDHEEEGEFGGVPVKHVTEVEENLCESVDADVENVEVDDDENARMCRHQGVFVHLK